MDTQQKKTYSNLARPLPSTNLKAALVNLLALLLLLQDLIQNLRYAIHVLQGKRPTEFRGISDFRNSKCYRIRECRGL